NLVLLNMATKLIHTIRISSRSNNSLQARLPNVNFYRERSGKEVDVMVRNRDGLNIYEIKAGSTFKPEFMTNMKYVSELIPDVSQRTVIYDGPTSAPLLLNIRDI
ncbi:MAG: DUF4143 domain-containing protein, partial [Muribaculaceae bacterium]|nr:DUF4143 domain-containing protein [Muribaculaceae bacterium]